MLIVGKGTSMTTIAWTPNVKRALASFGQQLRCPICLEFLSIPYSLPCNHCYCEPCITTALNYVPKCPVCKAPANRRRMRLDEPIQRIQNALEKLLLVIGPDSPEVKQVVVSKQSTTNEKKLSQNLEMHRTKHHAKENTSEESKKSVNEIFPASTIEESMSNMISESIVPSTANSVIDLSNSIEEKSASNFKPGDVVQVMSRTWPGINKPGGTAWITMVNEDDTYNVKYVLGGRENNVLSTYVSTAEEQTDNSPVRTASRKRISTTPSHEVVVIDDVDSDLNITARRKTGSQKKSNVIKEKEPMVLLCSGLSHEEKLDVETCAIKILQAEIVQDWTPTVTHIIVQCQHLSAAKLKLILPPSPSVVIAPSKVKRWAKIRSLKFLKALVSGRWIVSPAWIKDCLQQSKHIHEEPYEVQGLLKAHNAFEIAKKARLLREGNISRMQLTTSLSSIGTGLFKHFVFYVHGQFASPLPPKHEICMLIRLGAGLATTSWDEVIGYASQSPDDLPIVVVMESVADITSLTIPSAPGKSRMHYVGYDWVLDCISECNMKPLTNVI